MSKPFITIQKHVCVECGWEQQVRVNKPDGAVEFEFEIVELHDKKCSRDFLFSHKVNPELTALLELVRRDSKSKEKV